MELEGNYCNIAIKKFYQIGDSVRACEDPNQTGYLVEYLKEVYWVHFYL